MQYRTTEAIAVDASDDSSKVERRENIMTLHMPHPHLPHPHMPHLHMPHPVTALTHWRDDHPKHVKSDWDIHLHPHHQAFIETAAMARMMDRL